MGQSLGYKPRSAMDLDDIRIFTKVVEAGSFTKAARHLSLPKSTVSRRVGELEDRLGVLLLQRTTRKLHLTHAGEVYFARTSRVIEELQGAEEALHELQSQPRGLLRVTSPSDMSGAIPELIAEFQNAYPEVQVIVFATGRRVDLISEGYDVALRAGQLEDSTLVSRRLLKGNLALFASPEYLRSRPPIRRPEDLSAHQCLIFSSEGVETVWKLEGPDGPVEVPVSGRLATRDFILIRAAALLGQGVAFMPEISAARALEEGSLVRVLPEYLSSESNLYAVYPSPRHLSPKVRAFVDFAADWFASRLKQCQGAWALLDEGRMPSSRPTCEGRGLHKVK